MKKSKMLVIKSQQHVTMMADDVFAGYVLAAKMLHPTVSLKAYSLGVSDSLPVRRDKMF